MKFKYKKQIKYTHKNIRYKKYVIILCINIVYKNCVKILLNKVKAQQKNKKIKNNKIKNIV